MLARIQVSIDLEETKPQPLKGNQDMTIMTQPEMEAAVKWLFEQSKAPSTSSARLNHQLLFHYMTGDQEGCSPTVGELCGQTGYSKSTVLKGLRDLEECGEWVIVRPGGNAKNVYYPMFVARAKTELLTPERAERLRIANETKKDFGGYFNE
jgi:DNA-binding MarR family transcriptional regulator